MSFIRNIVRSNQYHFADLFNKASIPLDWVAQDKNFGDVLNPALISRITSRNVRRRSALYYDKPHLLGIGSILQRANNSSIVWGSGFISRECRLKNEPLAVTGVRGKCTAELLKTSGFKFDGFLGDPALLMPAYYKAPDFKSDSVAFIPHIAERELPIVKIIAKIDGVKFIDLATSDPIKTLYEILSCRLILSSSLHGVVIAEAYGIPSCSVVLSEKLTGGDFKFKDFYSVFEDKSYRPITLSRSDLTEQVINSLDYRVGTAPDCNDMLIALKSINL